MTESSLAKPIFSGPVWWVRLIAFLAFCWVIGAFMLFSSPGGAVQTVGTQIKSVLVTPIYAPLGDAFLIGGLLHSVIVFFVAVAACYIGAVVLACYFFATTSKETWFICLGLLALELLLAWGGQALFVSNMKGWT
jgi:hypothetical protein